jgi:hypothetical protein
LCLAQLGVRHRFRAAEVPVQPRHHHRPVPLAAFNDTFAREPGKKPGHVEGPGIIDISRVPRAIGANFVSPRLRMATRWPVVVVVHHQRRDPAQPSRSIPDGFSPVAMVAKAR